MAGAPVVPDGGGAGAAEVVLSSPASLDGAYARRGANDCSWTVGSPGIEKRFVFAAGSYTMTSFQNRLTQPAREYVVPGAVSEEFRFSWDGTELTGASGGWTCASGRVSRVREGGEPALRLDITLTHGTVQVVKRYLIHPKVALIREWVEYRNTDTASHRLTRPSFLEQRLMGDTAAATDLLSMGGSFDYGVYTTPLSPDYSNTIGGFSSGGNMPWFALWNRERKDGAYIGYDYMGSWSLSVGVQGGAGTSLSIVVSDYDQPLAAGQSIRSPKALAGVYHTDLDDMTDRLLAWQYGYMWDYTRDEWFPKVANEGYWCRGASWFGCFDQVVSGWDQPGTMQKVFNLVDSFRATGVDTYHRDNGWWDFQGDWGGEDWKITHDYLAKNGMGQIIYMPIYLVDGGAKILQERPELFPGGSLDMSVPAGREWAIDTLTEAAEKWGDFQWRPDFGSFPRLGDDQGYRAVIQGFLDNRPKSGFHAVNGGGADYGYDYLRFAEGGSFTDAGGVSQIDGASRIFPVDKLSGVPEFVSEVYACSPQWTALQLAMAPDMYGDSDDPEILECVRRMTDIYHYLGEQGVAGRWVHQYHPSASDDRNSNWFQRLSGDRSKGLVVYKGGASCRGNCNETLPESADNVTVYPKGLDARRSYDVRFQYDSRVLRRTGAQLMADGITFDHVHLGELIWLNLANHPGSGTDRKAPSAPSKVTATLGTNMNYAGVEVSWPAAKDNNWVSYYEVLRDGQVLGKVAKGTYYFDHTPGATPTARYGVRTVDGDGNRSNVVSVKGIGPAIAAVDDAADTISYSGEWAHPAGLNGPWQGTLSEATGESCHVACQQFGGEQGADGWRYQDGPAPECRQACQEFGGTQGAANWSYQNGPPAPPAPCQFACAGFSGTQGANDWRYQYGGVGNWSDFATYNTDDYYGDGPYWHDGFNGWVSARRIHPGDSSDTARAWTAPRDGVVDITGRAFKDRDWGLGGDGVSVTITKNDEQILAPQSINGTDGIGVDTNVTGVAVAAGDVIRFQINRLGEYSADMTDWDPTIHYQGDPPPEPTPVPDPVWSNITTYHADEDFLGDGPYWRDSGGTVSARLTQAAANRDVGRAWTAPSNGTVDVVGHVAKAAQDAFGSGAVVRITRNDEVVWGPRTVTSGDTTGVDTNLTGVAVAAGDVLRFEVGAGGGAVAWNLDVYYQGSPPPPPPAPAWTDIATYHGDESLDGDGAYWQDTAGAVSARLLRPSLARAVARSWTAPHDGAIDIAARASASGSVLRITRNGETVWGPRTAGDIDTNVSALPVSAGDVIRFEVAASGSITRWDPDVSYVGETPPALSGASASWTFTGTQVTWYAKLGPDKGVARVLIDGRADATIDLYAPDENNWSIPIYTKTFPTRGQHTITIATTGDKNARSTRAAVNIDGFRVITAQPKVTEDDGARMLYQGTGWGPVADARASAGRSMVSSTPGDSFSLRFTGSSVTWVGRLCPSCGVADVYLDGRFVTRIDGYVYRGPEVWQTALFQHSFGKPGEHTLRIVVHDEPNWAAQGSEVHIDNIRID